MQRVSPMHTVARGQSVGAREHTKDRLGHPVMPGTRVRLSAEDGQPEGTVLRVLDDYGLVTVVLEQKTGKVERTYRTAEIEVV